MFEIPGYLHPYFENIQVEAFQIIMSVLNSLINVVSLVCLTRMMTP